MTNDAPLKISYDDALRALNEVVAEKGEDFEYFAGYGIEPTTDGCAYSTPTGKGLCIVGCVLEKLGGIELNHRIIQAGKNMGNGVRSLVVTGFIEMDHDTGVLLGSAQGSQDTRATWGNARDYAVRRVEEMRALYAEAMESDGP